MLAALRERRFPQIVGGYLAAGWVVLQLVDQLVGNSIFPGVAYRIALVTYVLGIPAVGALAWFHGRPGRQPFRRVEYAGLGGVLLAWVSASAIVLQRGADAPIDEPPERVSSTDGERIGGAFLIAPFRNLSGSPDHDWLIDGSASLLADVLGQWREISVVPPERMYSALQKHEIERAAPLGTDVLARLAKETGSTSVVAGEVLHAGASLMIVARVYDPGTGRVVIDAREPVTPGADVREAYERLGIRLLRAAGLATATANLRGVTTQSLEAYKAYAQGITHLQAGERTRATRAFRSAVQIDSTFAQAWVRLALVSMQTIEDMLDPRSTAYSYAARAADLAARLPERERRYVEALHALSRGQFTTARATLQQMVAADSNDVDALTALIDLEFTDPLLHGTGAAARPRASFNRAVALAERALRLDPARHGIYNAMATLYMRVADPRPGRTLPPSAIVFGFAKEQERLADYVQNMPDQAFQVILRDSLEFISMTDLSRLSDSTLDSARARARSRARSWVDRWLAVAPRSAAAHLAVSRLAEFDQNMRGAIAAQHSAESLTAEEEAMPVAINRLALRTKQRRFKDAMALADSLRDAGYFEKLDASVIQSEGLGAAYALYLMRVDSAGTQRLLRTVSKWIRPFIPSFVAQGVVEAPKNEQETVRLAEAMSIAVFTSSKQGDMRLGQMATPAAAGPALLFEALDS